LPFVGATNVYSAGSARTYSQPFTGVPFLQVTSASNYVDFVTMVSGSVTGDITPANWSQYYFGQITYRTN
jgi:hypothetical protein